VNDGGRTLLAHVHGPGFAGIRVRRRGRQKLAGLDVLGGDGSGGIVQEMVAAESHRGGDLRGGVEVQLENVVAAGDRAIVDPIVVTREVVVRAGTALRVDVSRRQAGGLRGNPGWAVARADQVGSANAGCNSVPDLSI